MDTHIPTARRTQRERRTAVLVAAMALAGSAALATPAGATGDPGGPGGPADPHPNDLPGQTIPAGPMCFGRLATIVMTAPGSQQGTDGDDVIIGTSGDDFINSEGGHDRICAGGGVDRITADYDTATGTWDMGFIVIGEVQPDDDWIDGQDDGDVVAPGVGNDHVWGSDGTDYLYGQGGDDTIFGGDHQDWMDCDTGVDYADGGRGANDWVGTDHGCETLISAS